MAEGSNDQKETVSHVFSDLRKRGGSSGVREASVELMGITWDDITLKRQEYLEAMEEDMQKALNSICVKRNFSTENFNLPKRKKSILAPPTVKTPAPKHRMRTRASSRNASRRTGTASTSTRTMVCETIDEEPTEETVTGSKNTTSKHMLLSDGSTLTTSQSPTVTVSSTDTTSTLLDTPTGTAGTITMPADTALRSLSPSLPVLPTGATITPTGTAITPTRMTVTPTDTPIIPSGTSTTPTGTSLASLSPTLPNTRTGTSITPIGTSITPTGTSVTPTGTSVTPTGAVTGLPTGTSSSTNITSTLDTTPPMALSLCTGHELLLDTVPDDRELRESRHSSNDSPDNRVRSIESTTSEPVIDATPTTGRSHSTESSNSQEYSTPRGMNSTYIVNNKDTIPHASNIQGPHDIPPQQSSLTSPVPQGSSNTVISSIDTCTSESSDGVCSYSGPTATSSYREAKEGAIKTWNALMSSAMKQHHQQRLQDGVTKQQPLAGLGGGAPPLSRNSPIKAIETQQLRSKRLAEKIAEKNEREEARRRELQLKKEQEKLEKIKKREEKMKRIADNQAALKLKESQKLTKIKEGKTIVKGKQPRENVKLKERHLAAEQRRQEQERLKQRKLKEIEEERRLMEQLHSKRMKLEEEERQRKKEEKAELEKERLKRKEMESATAATAAVRNNKLPIEKVLNLTVEKTASTVPKKPLTQQNPPVPVSTHTTAPVLPTVPANPVPANPVPANPPSVPVTKPSKYQDMPSYEITPINKNPLLEADTYDIDDLASDESTDDEDQPKKAVPSWAAPLNLLQMITQQETEGINSSVSDIFPPEELLQSPDLAKIFPKLKKRFFKRTSSAQWTSPMLKKERKE